jgi:uncharacterized membrane protein
MRRSPIDCAAKDGRWLPTPLPNPPPDALPSSDATLTEPASKNIAAIAALEREALHERSALDRVTDAVTAATGSAAFLVIHAIWFTAWIAVNVTRAAPFDPFPFSLLTLLVSLEAIILTGIVLMTQNRMTRQADKRAHLDLQVNLLAEQELTAMLQMLNALCQRMGVPVPARDTRVEQFVKETDIHELATALDRVLVEKSASAPSSAPAPHTPSPHRS